MAHKKTAFPDLTQRTHVVTSRSSRNLSREPYFLHHSAMKPP